MSRRSTDTDGVATGGVCRAFAAVLLLALAPLVGACAPTLVIGAGAAAGNAAAQDRGFAKTMRETGTEAAISTRLLRHSGTLFTDVSVEVYDGRVLLTGAVEKTEHRIEAVRIAWQADGVREVINEIQVRDESDLLDATRDRWVTAQLSTKITFDKEIKSVNYSIETVNGTVYLLGVAQSEAELDKVVNHARQLSYVRRIISHVQIKKPEAKKAT